MSINRFRSWAVAMAGVLLLAGSVRAQQTPQNLDDTSAYGNAPYSNADTTPHRAFTPFGPVGFLQKFQPFAPVDISDYGNGIKPRKGFFFSYDRMEWTISRPKIVDVGAPIAGYFLEPGGNLNQAQFPVTNPVPSQPSTGPNAVDTSEGGTFYESNSANTSQLRSKFGPGSRFDFGYMDTNDYGWLISVIDHVSQNQTYAATGGTVLFNDPTGFLQGFVGLTSATTGSSSTGSTTGSTQDADLNGNGIFGRDGNAIGTPAPPDNGDARTFIPRFQYLSYSLHTELNGVEIMRMYRLPRLHNGAELDILYGVRYFSFYDRFNVFGGNDPTGTENGFGQQQPPTFNTGSSGTTTTTTGSSTLPLPNYVTQTGINIFDNFILTQKVQNNLIGPQVGLRYAMQRGRWKIATEGRFFAPANYQNTHQDGVLGSNYLNVNVQAGNPLGSTSTSSSTTTTTTTTTTSTQSIPPAVSALETRNAPANMHPLSFMSSLTQTTFSPAGEIRLNATYEITRAFGVNFGYTGMYMGNIARAPDSINYTLQNMGIFPNNRENVFINGLNVGFVFNR